MIKKVLCTVFLAWLALGAVSSFAGTVKFPAGITACKYGTGTFVDVNGAITVVCDASGSLEAKLSGTGCSTYTKVDVNKDGAITITCSSSGVQASQTITFGVVPPVTVGNTGTVIASASSGLPVTLSSTTPSICTLSGSTVTGVAVGTCTITATQAGNSSYSAAPTVTQNVSVIPASIRTASFSIGENGCTYSSVDVNINGLIDIKCKSPRETISPTATFSSAKKSCEYTTADVDKNGSFSVLCNGDSQAKQAITFGSAPTVAVGGTGTVSATGGASGLPVIFSTLSQDICTVSGNTVTGVATGTCTIAANQAGNSIFSPALQSIQSFSIAPKQNSKQSQTITFGGVPIITVGKPGTVSATASSGLPVTFSSTTPEICTVSANTVTALQTNKRCSITAMQGGNDTYNPAYGTRQFCIGTCPKSKDITPMFLLLLN
jgi:hypothetical protein